MASPIFCLLSVREPVPFAEIFQSRAPIHGYSYPHRSSEKPSLYPVLGVSLVMSFLSIIIEWNLPHYIRKSLDKNPVSSSVLAHPLPLEKSLAKVLSTDHHTLGADSSHGEEVVSDPQNFPGFSAPFSQGWTHQFQTSAESSILILLWIILC